MFMDTIDLDFETNVDIVAEKDKEIKKLKKKLKKANNRIAMLEKVIRKANRPRIWSGKV